MRPTFTTIMSATALAAAPAIAQDAQDAQDAPQESADGAESTAGAEDSWLPSLITEPPEKDFDLAVTMARKAVTTTQTDVEALHKLRPAYAHDPDSLIDVSGVVAAYFATIAEANNHWRD